MDQYFDIEVDIILIEALYPDLYKAYDTFDKFDKSVNNFIERHYGKDTLYNIIKTNQYHTEIDNVYKNILTNDSYNKIAQHYVSLFKIYQTEQNKLLKQIGHKSLNDICDKIKDYFNPSRT